MLIAIDSPLRKVPTGLDRRQQIVIDGLRISVDVVDLSFRRLCTSLKALPEVAPETTEFVELAVSANLDAWTIVDYVHRFSELLHQMPMIKQNLPQIQLLYRAASDAEHMRHYIQHVRNEVDSLAASGLSVWGSLTWAMKADYDAGRKTKRSLNMGTFYIGNFAAIGKIPQSVEREVDCIEIYAGGRSFELTGVLRYIECVIRGLERDIEDQAGHLPRYGSDLLAALSVEVVTQITLDPTQPNDT